MCWEEGREACQSSIAGLKTVKYGGYLRCARAGNGRHHPVFSAARPEPACLGPVVQPWRAERLKASLTLPAWTCMATPRPSHERAILWNQARKFVDVRQKAALSKTTTMTLWSMDFAQNRFATRKSAYYKVWNLRVVKIDAAICHFFHRYGDHGKTMTLLKNILTN